MKYFWKRHKTYRLYSISSKGKCKNRKTGKLVALSPDKDGYLRLSLYKHGKRYNRSLHSLVMETFESPCPPGKEINHKDGIKAHCQWDNLEYMTPKENMEHAHRMGLIKPRKGGSALKGDKHPNAKLNWEKVGRIKQLLAEGETQWSISQMFGVQQQTISDIHLGKAWK